MKIITKILILILTITTISCEDFLEEDPKGRLAGTAPLENVDGLKAALAGTYRQLSRPWWTIFGQHDQWSVLSGSDDIGSDPNGTGGFDIFIQDPASGAIAKWWRGLYLTIHNANMIVENYSNTTGSVQQVNQIAAEAYFLRATSYFYLTRLFGDVPMILSSSYSSDLNTINPSSKETVYAQIIADLQLAEGMIMDQRPEPGRVGKAAVKGMLAEVYLTMAGWPLNDQSKLALSAQKAAEVIANKEQYGVALMLNFRDIWTEENKFNQEQLWAIPFSGTGVTTSFNWAQGTTVQPGEEGGWNALMSEPNFYLNFPDGVRKDETFYTEFQIYNAQDKTYSTISYTDSQSKHPYFRKFRHGGVNENDPANDHTFQTSMSVQVLRLAQVYLTYAEAQARSAGPNTSASGLNMTPIEAVNIIRARAGLSDLPQGIDQNTFVQAVLNERAWEFAGEFLRWFDLVRTENVEQANMNRSAEQNQLLITISKDNYLLPPPAQDVAINENL